MWLQGSSSTGPKEGERCLVGERSRRSLTEGRVLGLRLNKEDKRGEVPQFGEDEVASGCSLGMWAAARTAVGRTFDAPPGKNGPGWEAEERCPNLFS